MQCKCGGEANRTFETMNNERTVKEATGRKPERLPCTVIKYRCSSCERSGIEIWYPKESKPVKPRSLLDLMLQQSTQ